MNLEWRIRSLRLQTLGVGLASFPGSPPPVTKPFWFSSHHPKGGPYCLMLGLCNNLLTGFCFHRSESSHAYENGLPTGLLCPVTSPCLGGRRWAVFPGCGNSCSPGWAIGILRLGLGFLCALSSEHTQVSASWGQPWLWWPLPSGMQTEQIPQDSGSEPVPVPPSTPETSSQLLGLH